jgi:hypothetical protein
VRRILIIGAAALAAAGLALAFVPFSRPSTIFSSTPVGGNTITLSSHCPAPVASAFRHDQPVGGWFGYAPLNGAIVTPAPISPGDTLTTDCRQRGANRLALALTLEVAAGALLLVRRRPHSASAQTVAPA